MALIQKIFHYICVIIASTLWLVTLAVILRFAVVYLFHIDPLKLHTYRSLVGFWNEGGVLKGKDILMFLIILSYIPLLLWGIYKLYRYKFLRLITVPLNKLANHGVEGYVAPEINIKNLKIEEKKTLEQVVQERLKEERKKTQQNAAVANEFRRKIIEQFTETKN